MQRNLLRPQGTETAQFKPSEDRKTPEIENQEDASNATHSIDGLELSQFARSPESASDSRQSPIQKDVLIGDASIPSTTRKSAKRLNIFRVASRSAHRTEDPLGLTVLHEPVLYRIADIIFVHGLGGSSRDTWSDGHDPQKFWPQKWLPAEPAIAQARILTFGYESRFPVGATGILDWATSLLFEMKYARDNNLQSLGLGQVSNDLHSKTKLG